MDKKFLPMEIMRHVVLNGTNELTMVYVVDAGKKSLQQVHIVINVKPTHQIIKDMVDDDDDDDDDDD